MMIGYVVPICLGLVPWLCQSGFKLPGASVRAALVILACICSGQAAASETVQSYRVLLIADERQPTHKELTGLIRSAFVASAKTPVDLAIQQVADTPVPTGERSFTADLLVTVGARAFERALASEPRIPVIAILIPKVTFDELLRKRPVRRYPEMRSVTAVYLEQSPSLQIELARQIFPMAKNIGIALGPTTAGIEDTLGSATRLHGLAVHVGLAENDSQLPRALDELLPKCDVLIGIVDPLIIGRTNAQSVLLAAYRHRVPLIGPSPSFVQAGALAAAYTTVPQAARELAHLLERWRPGNELPPPRYPHHFSISVNYRVAESFGVHIENEAVLEQRIIKMRGD